MRAGRDSPLRAEAIGIDVKRVHWLAFAIAGAVCGVAGGLFAFAKGSISPETIGDQPLRSTVWSWCCSAASRRWPGRSSAHRSLRYCRTPSCGRPNIGARCSASSSCCWCWCSPAASSAASSKLVARRGRVMSDFSIRSLSKAFGGVRAVNEVSFDIKRGEFLALIGPNGAGKSTCFNMINGQLAADSGEILFEGTKLNGQKAARDLAARRRTHLPGRGDVRFDDRRRERADGADLACPSIYRLWRPARLAAPRAGARTARRRSACATHADRPSRELAYGDVKRVELAIALANDPRLLLMDEPTAGMAPRERNELIALVKRLVIERGISRAVHRALDGCGVRLRRPHHRSGARPADCRRRRQAIRDNPQVREVYFGTGKTFAKAERRHERRPMLSVAKLECFLRRRADPVRSQPSRSAAARWSR